MYICTLENNFISMINQPCLYLTLFHTFKRVCVVFNGLGTFLTVSCL